MSRENRKAERFDDIGRVQANALCALPGVMDDISKSGCKVHFPIPLNVDMENDYTLELKLSKYGSQPLELLGHPQWVKQEGNETHIGFRLLTNQNSRELNSYIESLMKKSSGDEDDISSLIIDHQVTFIQ